MNETDRILCTIGVTILTLDNKTTITHGSYTFAWICALPLEFAAAKVVLDKVHPTLPQSKFDHNIYTLVSVSGHNVVIACLPVGLYGKTAAIAAVSHLTSNYPIISIWTDGRRWRDSEGKS